MTRTGGGSGSSSPPDPQVDGPGGQTPEPDAPPGRGADRAEWTRVDGIQGDSLDLLRARFGRMHYAPHVHDEFAIGVCVDGLETMCYRGERLYSAAGSILVIEPGEVHTGGPAGPDGYAYMALYPSAGLVEAVLTREPAATHFREPVIEDSALVEAFRLAHRALRVGEDPLEGETRLLGVLATLVGRHAVARPRPDGARGARQADAKRIARTVASRLAAELVDPPTLGEVAADLDLSRYQLLRAFRDAIGMPPYAWLAQHRVARARTLLEAGHRPAEAASLAGFADQAHLTRWFRRVVGVTPGVYRNSVQDAALRRPAP